MKTFMKEFHASVRKVHKDTLTCKFGTITSKSFSLKADYGSFYIATYLFVQERLLKVGRLK